jgi:hypothetical protein
MRRIVLTAAILALATISTPASAGRDDDYDSRDSYRYSDRAKAERHARQHKTRHQRLLDSAEQDRANNCDPAGRYSGYPAWARNAFSCGDRGR